MKSILLVTLLASLGLQLVGCADYHINHGKDKQAKYGDLEGAIAEYRTAIRLDPNHVFARIYLGAALEEQGDLEGAIAEYRVAIRLDPNHAVAHNNLGAALEKRDDLEGAIAEYRTALLSNSNLLSAHYDLGKALQAKGDFVSARKEFEEASQMIPQASEDQARIKTIQSILSDLDKLQP
jgi:tetratricopeptide (TPR) repeat protein